MLNGLVIAFMLLSSLGQNTQDFLKHEAGIAAYFQFLPPTNLSSNLLRNLFRTITADKSDYLIAYLPDEDYPTYPIMDSKILVHNDGWVVAYYLKDIPTARIVKSNVAGQDRLERALVRVADAMEISNPTIQYAHFQHETAETLLLIGLTARASQTSTMDFRLPSGNSYSERSWYISAPGLFCSQNFYLDGLSIRYVQNALAWDFLSVAQLVPNAKHLVSLQGGLTNSYWVLGLLYTGDADHTINYAEATRFISLPSVPPGLHTAAADVATYHLIDLPVISR